MCFGFWQYFGDTSNWKKTLVQRMLAHLLEERVSCSMIWRKPILAWAIFLF